MRSLIRRLRSRLPPNGEPTDERLLDDFLARRAAPEAEEAFAAIVRRHGAMVLGVCRRVLRNDADADDAFQAVWLVLIRKAESVRPRSQLGNWLYGVAVNVARRGRDVAIRRRTAELTAEPEAPAHDSTEMSDLRAVIDQELGELPEAYRAAVVACDLEGATRSEAAGRLGWSEGTVASRLARGRALLADRLARRGVAIPAAGLSALFGSATADAVPPVNFHSLNTSPPPAAEALAREAMKAMTTSKLKGVAVALLVAAGLAGAGTATVWACGGYGWLPRPAPPVSEAKPYPMQSVETTLAKSDDPAPAWDRPQPKELPAFAEKPGGGDGGVAKPALFVMNNPAKDITIISDRHEMFVEFFRRQPVMVAVVPANVRDKLLHDPKGSGGMVFVDNASFNVDGPRTATYGASVKLSPVTFLGPAQRLLEMTDAKHPIIFVRDAADENVWHAVGFTTRSAVGFFASKERVKPDDFAPADLLHHEKPEKRGVVPEAKESKPTRLTNPARNIFVISDRVETVPQFFARQPVFAGTVNEQTLALLVEGKGTPDEVFVDGTSDNDGEVFFGTFTKIAAPTQPVATLLAEHAKFPDGKLKGQLREGLTLFFVPDAKLPKVAHLVGLTLHTGHFFDINKKSPGDDFAPTDLIRKAKK